MICELLNIVHEIGSRFSHFVHYKYREFGKTAFQLSNEPASCMYLNQWYTDVNKLAIFGMMRLHISTSQMIDVCDLLGTQPGNSSGKKFS